MRKAFSVFILPLIIISISSSLAYSWSDQTHLAIAKASGYDRWYYAVGADMLKIKAGDIEKYNHFFNNFEDVDVTPDMVLKQADKYDDARDTEGHIYGALIATIRNYKEAINADGYSANYHLGLFSHYVGDLSQPLHNILYDDFNKQHHRINDGTVDTEIMDNINRIKENMVPVNLRKDKFEYDLANEIARIANNARLLGHKLKKENRDMTREEAYKQLGKSASLLHSVLKHLGKIN